MLNSTNQLSVMQAKQRTKQARRVVVTGIGLISPVGLGTEETWAALLRGESGVRPITLFDCAEHTTKIAGEVVGFRPERFIDRKDIKKMGRFIQFGVAAAEQAIAHARLDMASEDPEKVGVYVGSGIGAFEVIEREHTKLMSGGPGRVSPFFITATIANLTAGQIAIRLGATGPNLSPTTACTTGAHAIGEACRIIQRGDADVMIAGGSEAAITPLSVAGFSAMRALSTRNGDPQRASRPWDKGRDGFVLGEGAGILILEEYDRAVLRGAKPLAELVGYAANSDAYHTSAPPEDGRGIRRVMQLALCDAGLSPEQIGYLNAHATSTPLGDRAEAAAIGAAFGKDAATLRVSSTKSMTGHLLGAAGSLEAGITVLAVRDQIAPPTTNVWEMEEELGFDLIVNVSSPAEIEYAMSNSFGFGGTNASLIFRRFP
jgi:3-oxoacyl-[acyl-carrier-protein] synthase II